VARWPAGFAIEIEKRIPIGGGLGGGSADAGAVLRVLNTLAPMPLAASALLAIGASLGSDVPFLTQRAPLALGWGRGERLLALPALPRREVGLIVHPFGVSSGTAYGWVAASRAGSGTSRPPRVLSLESLTTWDSIATVATNDFEGEVGRRHPEVDRSLRGARAAGAVIAQLSGSGSTVFMVADSATPFGVVEIPPGARVIRTRTAVSVEDVELLG
jgi:4-diphosphocytidyl-2-C-methyl-D-erythritol kinase